MPLTKRIIPCLDVKDGVTVKGVRFRELQRVGDPPALAVEYQDQGADEIVFLDVNASVSGQKTLHAAVQRTAENLFIPLTVGGGIRSFEDVRKTLKAGADKVSINSAAVQDPSLLTRCSDSYGSQCVVVAIDAKRTDDSWEVYTLSGTKATGLDAVEWSKEACERGAGEILLTSMDADGTRMGYDLELTRTVVDSVNVPVIASGGCGKIEDIADVLTTGRADAALAASIFHYGEHTVSDVKKILESKGVPIRKDVVL
jgi:imidazole glycerol-phosphate synthase subunit HisF